MVSQPYFQDDAVTLWHSDCLDVLRTLPDSSVDSVVTDPPYDLTSGKKGGTGVASLNVNSPAGRSRISTGGFMGKEWDSTGIAFRPEVWVECLRVLKPGGHLLAFGGSRTSHRMACAIEDAGFEIRDSIAWLYGSGFPKHRAALKPAFEPIVMGRKPFSTSLIANEAKYGTGALNIDGCRVAHSGAADLAESMGKNRHADFDSGPRENKVYGTDNRDRGESGNYDGTTGRWPANVVLDGSQADALDAQTIATRAGKPSGFGNHGTGAGREVYGAYADRPQDDKERFARDDSGGASRFFPVVGRDGEASADKRYGDTGATDFAVTPGARREAVAKSHMFPTFRYEAKAPTIERPRAGDIAHPTVKPLDLMRWLVRLVTPLGGTVLEPFAGSGTTAEACILEGFKCIAIEREADYLPLIVQRISKPLQVGLGLDFGESA